MHKGIGLCWHCRFFHLHHIASGAVSLRQFAFGIDFGMDIAWHLSRLCEYETLYNQSNVHCSFNFMGLRILYIIRNAFFIPNDACRSHVEHNEEQSVSNRSNGAWKISVKL